MNAKLAILNRRWAGWGLTVLLGYGVVVSVVAQTQNAPGKTKPSPASPPRDVVATKSQFVDESGKDPFFPNSQRRAPKIVSRASVPADPSNVPLTVKLILVGQHRKLAQINNRSFAPGEQAEVLAGGQKVNVRCLEIREKSVLLSLEGGKAPREIFLHSR